MNKRNINSDLQHKIRRYVEYLHEEEKNGYYRGSYIFKVLSSNLQEEILKETYLKYVMDSHLFNNFFTPEFLKYIPLIIEEKNFAPGENIIKVFFENNFFEIINL